MNLTHVSMTPGPWRGFSRTGHRVLCSDGVVRAASMAPHADSFFSVPASVRVRGKHVSGFVTCDDRNGDRIWSFVAYTDGVLPPWPPSYESGYRALLDKAFREEVEA